MIEKLSFTKRVAVLMIAIANLILLNIHIKTKKLNAKKMIANIANPFNASAVYWLFIFSVFTVVLSLLL